MRCGSTGGGARPADCLGPGRSRAQRSAAATPPHRPSPHDAPPRRAARARARARRTRASVCAREAGEQGAQRRACARLGGQPDLVRRARQRLDLDQDVGHGCCRAGRACGQQGRQASENEGAASARRARAPLLAAGSLAGEECPRGAGAWAVCALRTARGAGHGRRPHKSPAERRRRRGAFGCAGSASCKVPIFRSSSGSDVGLGLDRNFWRGEFRFRRAGWRAGWRRRRLAAALAGCPRLAGVTVTAAADEFRNLAPAWRKALGSLQRRRRNRRRRRHFLSPPPPLALRPAPLATSGGMAPGGSGGA